MTQDKNIGISTKTQRSPKIPDKIPIRNPIKGNDHAALVRLGGLLEKKFQFIGILVNNITAAKKSTVNLFLKSIFMGLFLSYLCIRKGNHPIVGCYRSF